MSISDVYIDSVFISRVRVEDTGGFTTSLDGIANSSFLSGSHTNDNQTFGYRWCLSLVNKSSTTFDLGTDGIKIKMIGQYFNSSGDVTDNVITTFQIPKGTTDTYYFPGSGRYNVGHAEHQIGVKLLEGVDIQVDNSNYLFCEDSSYNASHTENAKIWATTRFELSDGDDNLIDVCGSNASATSPNRFVFSIMASETTGLGWAFYENNVINSWKGGTLSRSGGTYPTGTFNSANWTPTQHSVSSLPFLTSLEYGAPAGLTSASDFYIDTIYFDKVYAATTQVPYTGLTPTLQGANINSGFYQPNNTSGFRWVIQVVNKSGSAIVLGGSKRLRIKMISNYINANAEFEANHPYNEFNIVGSLESGTIGVDESVYFGYDSLFGTVTVDEESTYVVCDDSTYDVTYPDNVKILTSAVISLVWDVHGDVDIVGVDTHTDNPDKTYTQSIISSETDGLQRAVDEDTTPDSWDGGSYYRTGGTYPTTSYATADWDIDKTATDTELIASLSGDPHITTFSGQRYKFDYFGAFRLLNNEHPIPEQKLIINGQCDYGEGDTWNTQIYVRYLYISLGDKYIVVDTGFRGTKASVIKNKGFNVTETELELDCDADASCWDCSFTTKMEKTFKIEKHCKETGHQLKKPVRNKLEFDIELENETITFTFENVDKKNLQPCRFFINGIKHKHLEIASGCLIDKKYALMSGLKNIKSTKKTFKIDAIFEDELPENIVKHTKNMDASITQNLDDIQISNNNKKLTKNIKKVKRI